MSIEDTQSMRRTQGNDLSKSRRLQILIAVAIGTFMGPLDSSVVNIALPSIGETFSASLATVEWVVMSYLLVISSLLLTFGRLGDIYGHKKIYITGFVIFTLGSLLCAVSPTIMFLIIARAIQAIGAGMLMAMGPAIVTNIAPPKERGKYMGVIAISVSIALTAGPVLGGFLTGQFGWPSIFYINLPIGIFALVNAYRVIPETRGQEQQPFDIKGAITLFFALIALLVPLSYAEKLGWQNPYIIASLAMGALLLIGFMLFESRIPYPMVDLSMFKNRLFSMSNLAALINYIALFSVVLMMPFYLQQLRGMTPSAAGLLMIPMPLTTMIVAPLSGILSDRIDTRYISSLGMSITALGLWLLSGLQVGSTVSVIIMAMVVVGLGSGMFQTPNNSAIMGAVPPQQRGIASSMLAAMRNLGMVLGVAISGAVFSSYQKHLTMILTQQGLTGLELQQQAFTGAMHLTFVVAAAIAGIGVLTSMVRGSQERHNN